MDIQNIQKQIAPILKKYRVIRASIFGSLARGEGSGESDVDILVQLDDNVGLLEFVGLKLELEESLGSKVDLVEYDTIKRAIRDRVLADQVVVHG